jgi:hypothetical protein
MHLNEGAPSVISLITSVLEINHSSAISRTIASKEAVLETLSKLVEFLISRPRDYHYIKRDLSIILESKYGQDAVVGHPALNQLLTYLCYFYKRENGDHLTSQDLYYTTLFINNPSNDNLDPNIIATVDNDKIKKILLNYVSFSLPAIIMLAYKLKFNLLCIYIYRYIPFTLYFSDINPIKTTNFPVKINKNINENYYNINEHTIVSNSACMKTKFIEISPNKLFKSASSSLTCHSINNIVLSENTPLAISFRKALISFGAKLLINKDSSVSLYGDYAFDKETLEKTAEVFYLKSTY